VSTRTLKGPVISQIHCWFSIVDSTVIECWGDGRNSEQRRCNNLEGSGIEPGICPEKCYVLVPKNVAGGCVEEVLDLRLNLGREAGTTALSHPSLSQLGST
jgi:hypothetical protein